MSKQKKSKPKINFGVGDFVVVRLDEDPTVKPLVGQVSRKGSSKHRAFKNGDEEITFDFEADNVIANLGERPDAGNIFGVNFEPRIKDISTPFGDGAVYARFKKKFLEGVFDEIRYCHKKLDKAGLCGFLPIVVNLKQPKGKEVGTYTFYGNPQKRDVMVLRPSPKVDMKHAVYHEFAHGVWYNLLTDSDRSRWIKAYYNCVKIETLTPKEIKSMRKELQREGKVSTYKKMLEEEPKNALKMILTYINKVHSITTHDIDVLLSNGESLDDYWPKTSLEISRVTSLVSDYATKNSHEHFAECFANFMMGLNLPKTLHKLMKKTLSKCKGRTSEKYSEEKDGD